MQAFLLKALDAEEKPVEVIRMLVEIGTVVKFSARTTVLEKQILSHFLVQINPESREVI